MEHFIFFHPQYLATERQDLINRHRNSAERHGYIVLAENGLDRVGLNDHLTIVGHTYAPTINEEENLDDTGEFIHGQHANQIVDLLRNNGLRHSPSILSLECCHAGTRNGIGETLSAQPFLRNTLIECCTGPVGRSIHGNIQADSLGRQCLSNTNWRLVRNGETVREFPHNTLQFSEYTLGIVTQPITIESPDIAPELSPTSRLHAGLFSL